MSEIEEKEPMKLLPYVPKDGTSEKEKCLQKMRHDSLECLMKMTGMETLIENDQCATAVEALCEAMRNGTYYEAAEAIQNFIRYQTATDMISMLGLA